AQAAGPGWHGVQGHRARQPRHQLGSRPGRPVCGARSAGTGGGPCLYVGAMATQGVGLKGGPRPRQVRSAPGAPGGLAAAGLAFGVDTLIQAMPASVQMSAAGIEFAADGEVTVGPEFRALEAAWIEGVAAMARAGARIIVDEAFLGAAASQRRWQNALDALRV